jgi:hypothetical protein
MNDESKSVLRFLQVDTRSEPGALAVIHHLFRPRAEKRAQAKSHLSKTRQRGNHLLNNPLKENFRLK